MFSFKDFYRLSAEFINYNILCTIKYMAMCMGVEMMPQNMHR